MKILTVDDLQHSNDLRKPAKKVKNTHTTDIVFLLQEMERISKEPGVAGVAATQLGKHVRIFALNIEKDKPVEFYFNPKILSMSPETQLKDEGCLSVPGKCGYVERHDWVILQYEDRQGKLKTKSFYGFAAQAVQHEVNHLDGILYIDICDSIMTVEERLEQFNKLKEKYSQKESQESKE
jgi:peptide deformylase